MDQKCGGREETTIMCDHQPPCPPAEAVDRDAARVVTSHFDQGWSLLCNGVIVFDDMGALLPDGRSVEPPRRGHLTLNAILYRGSSRQVGAGAAADQGTAA
jgi:hypothetical protein